MSMCTCYLCGEIYPLELQPGHLRNCKKRPSLQPCKDYDLLCETDEPDYTPEWWYYEMPPIEKCMGELSFECQTNMDHWNDPDEIPF